MYNVPCPECTCALFIISLIHNVHVHYLLFIYYLLIHPPQEKCSLLLLLLSYPNQALIITWL